MPLERLAKIAIIIPRSSLLDVSRQLASIGYVHLAEEEELLTDRKVLELLSGVRELFVELDTMARDLMLREHTPIVQQMLKGGTEEIRQFDVSAWEDFFLKLKADAEPVLSEYHALSKKIRDIRTLLDAKKALLSSLSALRDLDFDLAKLERMKRFKVYLLSVSIRNKDELKRSLRKALLYDVQVGQNTATVLLITTPKEDKELDRVIKIFEASPLSIGNLQTANPSVLVTELESEIRKFEEELKRAYGQLADVATQRGGQILALKEACSLTLGYLERIAKIGTLKYFGVIRAFVPIRLLGELRQKVNKGLIVIEEERPHKAPTLMTNHPLARHFEVITLAQGPPAHSEIDPTPIIAFVFPVFYGLMFADAGQGLILALAGFLIFKRLELRYKRWGILLLTCGVAAVVGGLLVGEAFGIKLQEVDLGPLNRLFLAINVLRLESTEDIIRILAISIWIGAIHLALAFLLDVQRNFKEGKVIRALTLSLPTFLLYSVVGTLFAVGFVDSGYDFTRLLTSADKHPLLPILSIGEVTKLIVLPVGLVLSLLIAISHVLSIKAREEDGDIKDAMILGPVEWFLRITEFIANSISYVRIGIMLLAHAVIMGIVAGLYSNPALLPLAILGNIGVMLFEAFLVYIQALRLHIYEWFTKFYEGKGTPFQPISFLGRRAKIVFSSLAGGKEWATI
jgi:V/A-type H+-transporting ATPase subunit I